MTPITEWCTRWNIPQQAVKELIDMLHPQEYVKVEKPAGEQAVQNRVRLLASENGWRLWRNQVGACQTQEGSFIRYGLCNSSPQENKRLKSSDLVGIRPITITADMVGSTIGQFAAIEVKRDGWKFGGKGREEAQARYLSLVTALGGYGKFSTGEL